MSWSVYTSMSYPNSILNPISYVYVLFLVHLCPYCDGLGLRVEVSKPRCHWIESPLEQFLLKTRAVNSVFGNRNMIGKIPTWWENSVSGNWKTAGKNSAMVGNFPQWEKKSLPLHGLINTTAPSYMRGATYPFSLSVLQDFIECAGTTPTFLT